MAVLNLFILVAALSAFGFLNYRHTVKTARRLHRQLQDLLRRKE